MSKRKVLVSALLTCGVFTTVCLGLGFSLFRTMKSLGGTTWSSLAAPEATPSPTESGTNTSEKKVDLIASDSPMPHPTVSSSVEDSQSIADHNLESVDAIASDRAFDNPRSLPSWPLVRPGQPVTTGSCPDEVPSASPTPTDGTHTADPSPSPDGSQPAAPSPSPMAEEMACDGNV